MIGNSIVGSGREAARKCLRCGGASITLLGRSVVLNGEDVEPTEAFDDWAEAFDRKR